jgi:hypothetical protein
MIAARGIKIQGTGPTGTQKAMGAIEKATADCRLIQIHIDGVESQNAALSPAA